MRFVVYATLLIVAASLSACYTWPREGADYRTLKQAPVVTQKQGAATVIFAREYRIAGSASSFFVHDEENIIGVLGPETAFIHHAQPGPHTYWAEAIEKTLLTLDVKAGETYCILGGTVMQSGGLNYTPSLDRAVLSMCMGSLEDMNQTVLVHQD